MGQALKVDTATWEGAVLQSKGLVMVDFWAAWCRPCLMIAPTIEELATEYAGRLTVAKLNTELSVGHPRDLPMRMVVQRANGTLRELDADQHQVRGVRENLPTYAHADGFPWGLCMQNERLIAHGAAVRGGIRQNRARH